MTLKTTTNSCIKLYSLPQIRHCRFVDVVTVTSENVASFAKYLALASLRASRADRLVPLRIGFKANDAIETKTYYGDVPSVFFKISQTFNGFSSKIRNHAKFGSSGLNGATANRGQTNSHTQTYVYTNRVLRLCIIFYDISMKQLSGSSFLFKSYTNCVCICSYCGQSEGQVTHH